MSNFWQKINPNEKWSNRILWGLLGLAYITYIVGCAGMGRGEIRTKPLVPAIERVCARAVTCDPLVADECDYLRATLAVGKEVEASQVAIQIADVCAAYDACTTDPDELRHCVLLRQIVEESTN